MGSNFKHSDHDWNSRFHGLSPTACGKSVEVHSLNCTHSPATRSDCRCKFHRCREKSNNAPPARQSKSHSKLHAKGKASGSWPASCQSSVVGKQRLLADFSDLVREIRNISNAAAAIIILLTVGALVPLPRTVQRVECAHWKRRANTFFERRGKLSTPKTKGATREGRALRICHPEHRPTWWAP